MWPKVGLCALLLLRTLPAFSQAPQLVVPQSAGAIYGRVTDASNTAVAGATVTLVRGKEATLKAVSGADGQFSLLNVPPGPFRLTVSAPGFAVGTLSDGLAAGAVSNLPPIRLTLALGNINVEVATTHVERAEQQIKEQEQQRLFGVFPNFRVSYRADAVSLNSRQKVQLTWRTVTDPARFIAVGVAAGIQYARDDFSGFGRGPEGYARRYAALYGTAFTATMISNALLPSLFHQDPRYFYRGTGSRTSRALYAISRAVVRKADNGRWQPDYSRIGGSVASSALSNLYYPEENRRSGLLVVNTVIVIGGAAAGNLFQEFLFKRLTSHSTKAGTAEETSKGARDAK